MNGARLDTLPKMTDREEEDRDEETLRGIDDDERQSEEQEEDRSTVLEPSPVVSDRARIRLFTAFLIFGLLNNVLYVIILSAALDLVPASTPKGIVAFFNIAPSLLAKIGWPFLSRGRIRYGRRVAFCTAVSWLGMITVAFASSLSPRLFGISMASLSSGLGELTFLQLTTTLPTADSSKTALGAWSSGTGLAGIAGAGIWWLLRGLGVKQGVGLSSLLPLFFPLTYLVLLPPFSMLQDATSAAYHPLPTNASLGEGFSPPSAFVSLPDAASSGKPRRVKVILSTAEKMVLFRPLVLRYMVALCAVYIEEYVINSGIAPTLVFPLPSSGVWSRLFKSERDYYPFWSLTYQSFVFLSRSSLSLGLPAIPRQLLPVPAMLQFCVMLLLSLQSSRFLFASAEYTPPAPTPANGVDRSITFVFVLTCLEGLFGGAAYVNTFYHVGHEGEEGSEEGEEGVRRKMEKEFRIGAVGAADSTGILIASLISMPVEVALCNAQVARGRTYCRDL